MREWRKSHPLRGEARRRALARAYARVYLRRGKLVKQLCRCGSPRVEMHHEDYSKPLKVTWMCQGCRLAEHKAANTGTPRTRRSAAL